MSKIIEIFYFQFITKNMEIPSLESDKLKDRLSGKKSMN